IKYAGILSGVGAALLVIVLVGVFAGRDPVYTVSVAMARVEPAHGNTAQITLQATGYVTARRQATVSSKVMGKVDKLLVEEGEHVETGQVLAELDDSNTRKD